MTATMEQTEIQKMSAIFPITPPTVHIHNLPKNSHFISYRVDDDLTISAWMPNGFHTIYQERDMSYDDFYHRHCDGCERNCYAFLDEYLDEDGEVVWDDIYRGEEGHCFVYDNGYDGQDCPQGHTMESDDLNFSISNMVFQINITHLGELPRFRPVGDSAYLCAGKIVAGRIFDTQVEMASNVFGDSDHPEGICWGRNSRPDNLREIVSSYLATPFNNDLTSLNAFERHSDDIRRSVSNDYFTRNRDDIYLCDGVDADALILLDAEESISAFFTLLCAGYSTLPEAPHVMVIPVKEVEFERNGATYSGYQTVPDALNKRWFVTKDGLLVGQI